MEDEEDSGALELFIGGGKASYRCVELVLDKKVTVVLDMAPVVEWGIGIGEEGGEEGWVVDGVAVVDGGVTKIMHTHGWIITAVTTIVNIKPNLTSNGTGLLTIRSGLFNHKGLGGNHIQGKDVITKCSQQTLMALDEFRDGPV